jgi:DNA-binding NtrC family response regulator
MGTVSGLELLKMWKQRQPLTPFILMTAFGEISAAVEALKCGAEDYLVKPINPGDLLAKISQCFQRSENARNEGLRGREPVDLAPGGVSDRPCESLLSPGMSLEEIERAAIQRTLAECGGNRTRSAQALGISVRTLQRKLKSWGSSSAAVPIGARQ